MRSFDDVDRMFHEMDRAIEQFRDAWWNGVPPSTRRVTRPPLVGGAAIEPVDGNTTASLEEREDAYVFVMDLPGFERDDIELTFRDGVLSVRAHRDLEEGTDRIRAMRSTHVARQVTVQKEVVLEDVSATYRNGVLEVHLPIVESERGGSDHHIDVQ